MQREVGEMVPRAGHQGFQHHVKHYGPSWAGRKYLPPSPPSWGPWAEFKDSGNLDGKGFCIFMFTSSAKM